MWLLLTLPGGAIAAAARYLPSWAPDWIDKPTHFFLFLVLGWLLQGSFSLHFRPSLGAVAAVGLGFSFGAVTELWQIGVPGRSGELGDLAANSLGTIIGVALRR
jgi:VanZ family protein